MRDQGQNHVMNRPRSFDGQASSATQSTASSANVRRMMEPLDESGAPFIKDIAGVTGANQCPLDEQIRLRAYERYLQRQGRPGSPEGDWMEAEREVRSSSGKINDKSSARPPRSRA